MKNMIRPLLFVSLIAFSLRTWAEPPVLKLSAQQPSEGEFIKALQAVPETNWLEATVIYPNGLAGVPVLYHAVANGMTNAIELLIHSPSRYTPTSESMFDPIGAAIALKRWDILDRLLSSDVGQRIANCSRCDYLGLLAAEDHLVADIKHLDQLAQGCGSCEQNGHIDNILLSAIGSTNTSLAKVLMRSGAKPQHSLWYSCVVAMGNATLETQLTVELESTSYVYLSSAGAILNIGGVELALEKEALSGHDWFKTLESAATRSGFRSVLIELMDEEGARIFNSVVHPAAIETGVNVFLRDQAVSQRQ